MKLIFSLLMCFVPSLVLAAGHAFNENFSVLTPSDVSLEAANAFAQSVLTQAEQYRKQIATEWLGQELPPSVGRTFINVNFSDTEDSGLTWAIDSPRRTQHTLYLSTSPERALGSTLAHEIAHVVLATRFPHPNRLPVWLEEGIASRYDDQARIAKRRQIIQWFRQTDNWPRLEQVLRAERISGTNQSAYAVAASLTEMLLARGDRQKLLRFGQTAVHAGLQPALRQQYGISSVAELQQIWQRWVTRQAPVAAH